MKTILKVKNLNKKVNDFRILKNVSFEVPKGSVCAFIGHNGAGKTTTIKSIMGLFKYDKGEIFINDISSTYIVKSHMNLGYVPEKENFPKIKAKSFLFDMASFYDIDKKTIHKQIDYYAKVFNFHEKLNIPLNRLSSGQRKKVLIMQSLIHNPDLIIMDEPTENLDPDTRDIFYKVVHKLVKQNKTIFISTHNLDEIKNYCDYVVIIVNGQIKYSGYHNQKRDLHAIYNKFKPKSIIDYE